MLTGATGPGWYAGGWGGSGCSVALWGSLPHVLVVCRLGAGGPFSGSNILVCLAISWRETRDM